jgi:hypothetical protein
VDGSESGGHAVTIWGRGSSRSAALADAGEEDAAVGGELATTWLGRQAGWLAEPLRRREKSEGDWDHRIRLDERIRDEIDGRSG